MRHLFFVLTLGIALQAQTYEAAMTAGDKAFKAFDPATALQNYEAALALKSDDYKALVQTIICLNDVGEELASDASEGKYEKAWDLSKQLVELYPDSAMPRALLAVSVGNLALFKGSEEKVKLSRDVEKNAMMAMQMDPTILQPYIVMGIYYREVANLNWFLKMFARNFFGGMPEGTLEDSERMFKAGIERFPNEIILHFELAKTLYDLDKEEEALKHMQNAAKLDERDHQDARKKQEAKALIAEWQ
jgi:tetratricopeptide (TPR) repeat protein